MIFMKIVIFGAGALGSLIGGLLSINNDVLFVGREKHIRVIEKEGLKIKGITEGIFYPKTRYDGSRYDLVILTTKAYDTGTATRQIMKKFGKIPILSLQNGLKNEEIIAEIVGKENAIGGITSHGVTFSKDGEIFHAGKGETVIGELDGKVSKRIKEICRIFNEAGIETRISRNIAKEIWKKTIINCAINTITSILKCKNGEILKNKYALTLLEKICMECIEVAKAEGIEIKENIFRKVKEVASKTANNYSSMLQDIMKGKRTEIEEINGEIIKIAKKNKMKACINETLYFLIKGIECAASGLS